MRRIVGAGVLVTVLGVGPAFAQAGFSVSGVGDASAANKPSSVGLGSVEAANSWSMAGFKLPAGYSTPAFSGRSVATSPSRHPKH